MSIIWKPSVTVAAIIEQDGRFLLVEEETREGVRFNQPAGHLELGESLEQAVIRETMEETAYELTPTDLLGIYMSHHAPASSKRGVTYLSVAFCGKVGKKHDRPLDTGILRTHWMLYDEVVACQKQHRSPSVMLRVDDYLSGKRLPLSSLVTHLSVYEAAREKNNG